MNGLVDPFEVLELMRTVPWVDRRTPDRLPALVRRMREAVVGCMPWVGEMLQVTPPGQARPVLWEQRAVYVATMPYEYQEWLGIERTGYLFLLQNGSWAELHRDQGPGWREGLAAAGRPTWLQDADIPARYEAVSVLESLLRLYLRGLPMATPADDGGRAATVLVRAIQEKDARVVAWNAEGALDPRPPAEVYLGATADVAFRMRMELDELGPEKYLRL